MNKLQYDANQLRSATNYIWCNNPHTKEFESEKDLEDYVLSMIKEYSQDKDITYFRTMGFIIFYDRNMEWNPDTIEANIFIDTGILQETEYVVLDCA
jgi:hypothetical protein